MKLKKLDFIDTKRFKRGVDMDVKMQLLTVAIKQGKKQDPLLIEKASLQACAGEKVIG